jgi:FdrA protein
VAAIDAADALAAGLDVMIFSDNVAVADEVALKELAARSGRLVMGPDCGTAVVGGVGLGFANVVRPGPVGIVAASGTGAQHLLTLLDGAGIGVTHCLGVGGRDLSAEIGGRSTLRAIDRLAEDPEITTIVLVSKPPAPEVADRVTAHAQATGKQVVVGYVGPGRPDLTATAAAVAAAVGVTWSEPRTWGTPRPAVGPYVRGLFSGGTLCDEAMIIAAGALGQVASNIALPGQPALDDDLTARGHTFIDFGDDRLTVGRPHPMIDSTLRVDRLRRELADPECGVVQLDVVLGHAAHPDPAADLAPVVRDARAPVLVSLVGSRDDPQQRDETAEALAAAGAVVHASNAAAARAAVGLVTGGAR